jgi:hypothetical protein
MIVFIKVKMIMSIHKKRTDDAQDLLQTIITRYDRVSSSVSLIFPPFLS